MMLLVLPVPVVLGLMVVVEEVLVLPIKDDKPELVPLVGVILLHAV
jgi:hypothetical protein